MVEGFNTEAALERRKLFLLDPTVTFLNHGSFGACPRPVFEHYQDCQRELERQPVEFLARRAPGLLAEARAAVGTFVGAEPDDLVFVPNATTGLNIVARSLALQPGDEVLSNTHEYGALDRTWTFICAKRGAHYIRQPLPLPLHDPQEVVEGIWSGVTSRTRVLFLSHITSSTALTFPVAELIQRACEERIWTVIDGAHGPGQIPLDLEALGADFYSANLHKWACAPKGSAFLHARRDVQPILEPLVVSWGWDSPWPGPSRFLDEQEYQGTRDLAPFLAAPEAIRFLAENNWDMVRDQCHLLVRYARARLMDTLGVQPMTPDSPDWFRQMVAFVLPPCDGNALKTHLYDEFRVEVPIFPWEDGFILRVACQGYNTPDDIDALIVALEQVWPQVRV